MKLILVNQRYGHTRTIVIRGWMKGLLSLCLLGAPLALACLGYELALADVSPNTVLSQNAQVSSDDTNPSAEHICGHCTTHMLFDDGIEHASNHPCFNDSSLSAFLLEQPAFHDLELAQTPYSSSASLAVFPHGRMVDPARYAYVTLI